MTGTTTDWATLSTPEFVGWARSRQLSLPFPLNTGEREWIEAPDAMAVRKLLDVRQLSDSPALERTAKVFARPRIAVFVVRAHEDGSDERYVALAGHSDNRAAVVVMDAERTAVREVPEHELVAAMVGALPPLAALRTPTVEIAAREMSQVDQAFAAGAGERERAALMHQAGFPPELVALRDRIGNRGATTGVVGAVAFDADGRDRAAGRGVTWREYPEGGVLQIEQPRRRGEPTLLIGGYTPDAVFRAAADLMTDLYAGG